MTRSSVTQRQIRVELLRARAAVERETLARNACAVANSLTPSAILRGLMSGSSRSSRSGSNWLLQGIRLLRRYPFVLSGASALVGGVGRRKGLLRAAVGLVAGWQMLRSIKKN